MEPIPLYPATEEVRVDCPDAEKFAVIDRIREKALKEYTSLCATIGRNVSFFRNSQQLNGVAEKIDNNGELVVKLEDGTLHTVNSGEVTVQGIY